MFIFYISILFLDGKGKQNSPKRNKIYTKEGNSKFWGFLCIIYFPPDCKGEKKVINTKNIKIPDLRIRKGEKQNFCSGGKIIKYFFL